MFETLDESLQGALIKDINEWAPGIEIIAIRVTKPRIPKHIQQNFEEMESQKTEVLIAEQKQKVAEKVAETERKRKNIEAQAFAEVAKINMEKMIMEREA